MSMAGHSLKVVSKVAKLGGKVSLLVHWQAVHLLPGIFLKGHAQTPAGSVGAGAGGTARRVLGSGRPDVPYQPRKVLISSSPPGEM